MSKYVIETQTSNGQPINVPVPDEWLDQLRTKWARELAEEIRGDVPEDENTFNDPWYRGLLYAACLIDPDKESC